MRHKQSYKPLRLALYTALMYTTLAACSNSEDDIASVSTGDNGVPLSISAVIQAGDGSRKASHDAETFEKGDTIGLYILDSAGNAYNEDSDSYNVPAVYNGTYFSLTQDVYLTDSVAYVYAYYPYSSETSGNYAVIDISSGETDVLAAEIPATASRDNPQVTLSFYHSLARVTLSVKLAEDIWDVKPTSASVYWEDCNDVAELRFFDQLVAYEIGYEEYVTITRTVSCSATLSSTESTDIDILLYPSEVEGKTASLVIDGDTYEFDIPTTLEETWTAGGQYTYPITITKTSVTEEDDITEDTSETINGYDAVDLGLSVRWATVNIGAESPEDYGNYYAWGEIETKDEYTQDNSVNYTYGIDLDDISGNAEYDAATANWGGSWRMPTGDELNELVNYCICTWITENDVNGYLLTGINGNSIFLPAAGCFIGSDNEDAGNCADYWGSTRGSDTRYPDFLYFDSNGYSNGGLMYYIGATVRPVTE